MRPASLVVYDTWSGNTQKIAEAIATGLGTRAVHVDHNPEMPDFLVVGSYTHFGASPKLRRWLKTGKSREMVIVVTYGVPGRFGEITSSMAVDELRVPGVPVRGVYKCLGNHALLRTALFHPTAEDVLNARSYGASLRNSGLGAVMIPWVNQNLPFACGISQGIQRGMPPDAYRHDPDNWCSSPMWYRRGYVVGTVLRDEFVR